MGTKLACKRFEYKSHTKTNPDGQRTPTSRPKHVPHDASAVRHICPHRMPELGEPDGLH